MDHREPGRTPPADGPAGASLDPRKPRFPRLAPIEFSTPASPKRLLGAILGVSAAVLVLVFAASVVWRRSTDWLHARPAYRLDVREIDLRPEPPAWCAGGKDVFLAAVARSAVIPSPVSTLDLDLGALRLGLRNNPLVKRVGEIKVRHPNKVVVDLVYREPVAVAWSEGLPEVVIDDEAVLLPPEAVRPEAVKRLVGLSLSREPRSFSPPVEPRAGEPWRREEPAELGRPARLVTNPRVAAAARLAAVVMRATPSTGRAGPPPGVVIHDTPGNGFYVQLAGRFMFRWETPGGGDLSDAEKWARARDWVARQDAAGPAKVEYKVFTRLGVAPDPGATPPPSAFETTGGNPGGGG